MTEKFLIQILSEESERIGTGTVWMDDKEKFDMDICGWKDSNYVDIASQRLMPTPASFRIRVVDNKGNLKRNFSNKSQLSTLSSTNVSRSSSPAEPKNLKNKKKEDDKLNIRKFSSYNLYSGKEENKGMTSARRNDQEISIKKPPIPRKQRKPIKVFKLNGEGRDEE